MITRVRHLHGEHMQTSPITPSLMAQTVKAVSRSSLFAPLNEQQLATVVSKAEMVQVGAGETVMEEGTESDSFFVILRGEAVVYVGGARGGEETEVGRLGSPEAFGEMGLLRGKERSATIRAGEGLVVVKFDSKTFKLLFEKVPGFGMAICRALADRLDASSRKIPMASAEHLEGPDATTLAILPMGFLQRHRVLPMRHEGNSLTIGFVGEATPAILNAIRTLVPGAQLQSVAIPASLFESTLSSRMGKEAWEAPGMPTPKTTPPKKKTSASGSAPALDKLLHRMVEEGASDLHLCGSQQPRWRIDGEIRTIVDAPVMGEEAVLELMGPILPPDNAEEFSNCNDTDFAYAIDGLARFRVNMYRDHGGVGGVLRVIPDKILTLEQLGMPKILESFCEIPKGLVVVTGPTGSGKSTTLAAMLDFINRTRAEHVIALEDPIEFLHKSKRCLFNQREVGSHTKSFHSALRAALREDPDIVLIGEMRDRETVEMAMETANTGHLVFGTLHTATAISTIERIVSFYPSTEWGQVRAALADSLRGVVAQTLCKRRGGGRAAAVEILIMNHAVQNAIRLDKVHQIYSLMETGGRLGQTLLNAELARLVGEGTVDFEEALRKTLDRPDLAKRCGKALPTD